MTTKKVEELRVAMLKGRTDLQDFMDSLKVEMSPEEIEKFRKEQCEMPEFSSPLADKIEDGLKHQIVIETKEDATELLRLQNEMTRTQQEFFAAFMEQKNQQKNDEETAHT